MRLVNSIFYQQIILLIYSFQNNNIINYINLENFQRIVFVKNFLKT